MDTKKYQKLVVPLVRDGFSLLGYKCRRCLHEWVPRVPNPERCPRCKRFDWDKVTVRHFETKKRVKVPFWMRKDLVKK